MSENLRNSREGNDITSKVAILCNVIPREENDTKFMHVCDESPELHGLHGSIARENPAKHLNLH